MRGVDTFWTGHNSFARNNATAIDKGHFKNMQRINDTHKSITDADLRLYRHAQDR